MSKTVEVRNLVIGTGTPKICIPVMGKTIEELKAETEQAMRRHPDIVEWRADFFEGLQQIDGIKEALDAMRILLGDTPLIFTVRTAREGGKAVISAEEYLRILSAAIEIEGIDLIDVEICHGDDIAFMLITLAHDRGLKVVASSHDFQKTPKKEEMIMKMCKMQELEADIPKLAVMPANARDVLVLLDATLSMKELHGETPVITMAMGEIGKVSRLSGSVFGSAVTFGTAGKASAPGQMEAEQLRKMLL